MGVKSVIIIHKIDDRIDFLFLAEFFRFCGFYVGEKTIQTITSIEDMYNKPYDVYIWIPPVEDRLKIPNFIEQQNKHEMLYFQEIRRNILSIEEKDAEIKDIEITNKKSLLKECLEKMKISISVSDSVWNSLVNIYVDNDLMFASTSMQYYSMKNSFAIQDANAHFLNAYNQIIEIIRNDSDINRNARYAKLWLAVKINSTCEFQKKSLYFEPSELVEECKKLFYEHTDFSNVKVLEGLCYEHSTDKGIDAIYSFKQALRTEYCMEYSAAIYYWIGKRYEAYKVRQNVAESYYQAAYNTNPKFRNIYKLAVFAKNRNDFESTQIYFAKIIDILVETAKMNMLDPLELEYAFKSYQQMCHMYYDKCTDISIKYEKIVYYAQAAIGIRKLIDSSIFYDRLYGKEKADIYRDISRRRINLNSIYLMLSNLYSDIKEFNLAEKYKELIVKGG